MPLAPPLTPATPAKAPPGSEMRALLRALQAGTAFYAHVDGRRLLVQLAYTALLAAAWLTVYAAAGTLPHRVRADVDTVTLPRLETHFFGHYVGAALPHHTALDVLAAVPYALHFAVPFLFAGFAVAAHAGAPLPHARPLSFLAALVTTSALATATQLVWPTAPPWYVQEAGHAPASYGHSGDPGGLARLDTTLNMSFFHDLYRSNPIVFGSFPSMHAGWPIVVLLHQWTWRGRVISLVHVVWICWAALYLRHHYVVDLVGAYVYAQAGVWLARVLWLLVGRFLGGADGLFGLLDAPLPCAEARAHAERAGDARFLAAVYAVVLGRGTTPFSAPDVWRQGVRGAAARALWTPDLGDSRGAAGGCENTIAEKHAHV